MSPIVHDHIEIETTRHRDHENIHFLVGMTATLGAAMNIVEVVHRHA